MKSKFCTFAKSFFSAKYFVFQFNGSGGGNIVIHSRIFLEGLGYLIMIKTYLGLTDLVMFVMCSVYLNFQGYNYFLCI